MVQAILGTQIRERRRQIGITQVDLAQRIGISPSYLNLIERNKRRIAGPLLRKTAEALGLGLDELDGAAERRLAEALTEIAHLPEMGPLNIEVRSTGELIGRYPGWSRALAALVRSERDARQTARALSDRLTHDPYLGETVHRMLSRVSAIRSIAEILTEFDDIPPDQMERFHKIIADESTNLSDVGEALATYFDKTDASERTLTPLDEVESFFEAHANHFEDIETATASMDVPDSVEAARADAQTHLGGTIDALVARAPQIETTTATARARAALLDYAATALLLPHLRFGQMAAKARYDIETLAAWTGLGVQVICRRLATLPPDGQHPRFGYICANASGTIVQMLALEGLAVPRYAGACPLWVLFRAQQTPGVTMSQLALFPSGARFVFAARARLTESGGFRQPRHYLTDMIAVSAEDAARTVYGDGAVRPEEVGPACRLCPRTSCLHRVEDPLIG